MILIDISICKILLLIDGTDRLNNSHIKTIRRGDDYKADFNFENKLEVLNMTKHFKLKHYKYYQAVNGLI